MTAAQAQEAGNGEKAKEKGAKCRNDIFSTTKIGRDEMMKQKVKCRYCGEAIVYETVADSQQMKFQTEKHRMLKEGKKLEELPEPYNLGFNTVGLWNVSRHPNYFAEQAIWVCLYLFAIAAGVVEYGIFNWTIIPCLLLILLFMGSSVLGEAISSSKYPLYKDYQKKVFKYLPIIRYKK